MKALRLSLLLLLLLTMAVQAQDAPLIPQTQTAAGQATALPAEWNEATPIPWLNQQAALTAQAPVDVTVAEAAPVEAPVVVTVAQTDVHDAYSTALNALIAVTLAILGAGVAVTGLAIWKFAPVVLAILEFLARLTPRADDDAAVATLRAELERLGLLQTQAQAALRQKYGTLDPNDTLRG